MLQSRSIRSLLAAAGLVVGVGTSSVIAQTSGTPSIDSTTSVRDRLDAAAQLLTNGKVVQARSMLMELTSTQSLLRLSNSERERALAMAANAARRVKQLSAEELKLQSAEDCLLRQELALAIVHAEEMVVSPNATNAQVASAKAVVEEARAQQALVRPRISDTLDEVQALIKGGSLVEARAMLESLQKTGVGFSERQQDAFDAAQMQVLALRDVRSDELGAMGMMQPGIVRRRTDPPAPPAPSEAQPAPAAPAPAPAPVPAPAPAPAPKADVPAPVAPPAVLEQPVVVTPPPAPEAQTTPLSPRENRTPGARPREIPPVAQEQPAATPAPSQPAPVQSTPAPVQSVNPVDAARKVEAQALLAEADYAFGENRLGEASAKYARVINQYSNDLSSDELAKAQSRLSETRVRLGGAGSGNLLEQTMNQNLASRQQAEAEFTNALSQADAALARGDTQRARQLIAQARAGVTSSKSVFSASELEDYSKRADGIVAKIDSEDERLRTQRIETQRVENEAAAKTAAKAQADDKSRRVNEAIDRARALQKEMKYEDALQVVDNILFLDPTNPTGLLLRDVFADAIVWQKAASINRERVRSYVTQDLANDEAMIAPDSLLDYPKDWPAISASRSVPVAFAEAEDNRRALSVLQSKRIPVSFTETPLENVVGFVQAVTQLNVDTDWQALETVGIDRATPVTLNLTNVTVETVLNRVAEKVSPDALTGAAWTIADGVLTISTREQINRQKIMAIYDIRDLLVEVPNYGDLAPNVDLQSALQQGGQQGGGGGQSPFTGGNDDQDTPGRTLQERTNDLLEIITTNVDPDGWRDNGGDVGFIQQLNGLLIITNTPSNHRSIDSLLSKLREFRALQINVEARFLLVNQDFFEQIGIDFDVYFNAESNVTRTARAARPTTRASDFFSPSTGAYNPNFPTSGAGANLNRTPLGSPWTPIGTPSNTLGLAESLISSSFSQDVFAQAPALSLAGQFLDDIQVDFLIKATQADRRTQALTAPRLTFTNGQESFISVGTQNLFITDLQPVVSDSAVGFDPQPTPINEGVTLRVNGTSSADRRYVTMNIRTSITRIDSVDQIPVVAVAGGQLVNSGAAQQFIQLPTLSVTQVATTATVPDQGTLLIGGQRLTTESEVESGVPVLSKIPILNRLFTNRIETKEEQTLMILIKPTILIQNEEEQRQFPGIDDALRMPFGSN
jgi:type II secretory pathway component GspD/PulD (secretin)